MKAERDTAWKQICEGIKGAVKKPSAAPIADQKIDFPRNTAPTSSPQVPMAMAVDSSGMWILIKWRFFEAETVSEKDGVITATIVSGDAETDAAMKTMMPSQYSASDASPFAHANDALIVRVKSVESHSEGGKKKWIMVLTAENIGLGGNAMETTISTNKGTFTPERAAELRAGRILFNDPPLKGSDYQPGGDFFGAVNDGMAEYAIQGSGPHPVKGSGVREICSNEAIPLPQRFQLARLSAIFQLIVGDAVEHVRYLAIGPIAGNKVKVKFRGTRTLNLMISSLKESAT